MTENPTTQTNWNALLGKLQSKTGKIDSSKDSFQIPEFYGILNKGGTQVKCGRRLLEYNRQTGEWTVFERNGPARWEPANKGANDEIVLSEYGAALKEYLRN
jgi:hypothetical protein